MDPALRLIPTGIACEVLKEHFAGSVADLPADQLFAVVAPYEDRDQVFCDEFLQALREPLPEKSRSLLRTAFRKLDPDSEGVIDFEVVRQHLNPSRDPRVAEGSVSASVVEEELVGSMHTWLQFRRCHEEPTLALSWDEWEDFFLAVHPCFPDFDKTFEKIWDLDKSAFEGKKTAGQPAAGIQGRSRVGLHHWQEDTLPRNVGYRDACEAVDLEKSIARVRGEIAERGLGAAVAVVNAFVAMDDDMDNRIDISEFMRACSSANIKFLDSEEEVLFSTVAKGKLLPVFGFLAVLHGELSQLRENTVKEAFANIRRKNGGWSDSVPPSALRRAFTPGAHPAVIHGKRTEDEVLREFLDTFTTLTRAMGGCKEGNISYDDFVSYYVVVSSTIPTDSYFQLLVRRLWGVEKIPGALTAPEKEPPLPGRFPHIESTIVMEDATRGASDSLAAAWPRLRATVAKRGLKGWKILLTQAKAKGPAGKLLKSDWARFLKTSGLGLSADEQEVVMAKYSDGGYIKSGTVLDLIRGELSPERHDIALGLFSRLANPSSTVSAARLCMVNTHPTAVLGGKQPHEVQADWEESIAFFAPSGGEFGQEDYMHFMSYVSAIHARDDEFKLLVSEIIAG
jgi:Ca2+-binding EF-hand superfamily protein